MDSNDLLKEMARLERRVDKHEEALRVVCRELALSISDRGLARIFSCLREPQDLDRAQPDKEPDKMVKVSWFVLNQVVNTLDEVLGDTDPLIPEEYTDEDIRSEEPLLWVMQTLVGMREGETPQIEPEAPEVPELVTTDRALLAELLQALYEALILHPSAPIDELSSNEWVRENEPLEWAWRTVVDILDPHPSSPKATKLGEAGRYPTWPPGYQKSERNGAWPKEEAGSRLKQEMGKHLRACRVGLHISLRDMAKAIGVTHVILGKAERGLVSLEQGQWENFWDELASKVKENSETRLDGEMTFYYWRHPVICMESVPPTKDVVVGDAYIVGPQPTGAWKGRENSIVDWMGKSWGCMAPPVAGDVVEPTALAKHGVSGFAYVYNGTEWCLFERNYVRRAYEEARERRARLEDKA
jgi:hypothetical protein